MLAVAPTNEGAPVDEQRRTHYWLRAVVAKEHELAAHLRAASLHERAAELQQRLGHDELAAAARVRADHARASHHQALAEQAAARSYWAVLSGQTAAPPT